MARIEPVTVRTPGVADLVTELDRYQIGLYGVACCHLDSLEELDKDHVTLLGAFEGAELAGIGALKRIDDGFEIKRMIVAAAHRGKGVAREIMRGLEALAGRSLVRLETGVRQGAARRLYAEVGYRECEPFGAYVANDVSIFMCKDLR